MSVIYDPYTRAFQEDPYPLYRHFRDEEPCTYNAERDFYALFRFEDVWDATLDWKTYSSRLGPMLDIRTPLPDGVMSIIGMDPPRHTRLRNVVSRGFTPKRIAELEDELRQLARASLERVAAAGTEVVDIQRKFSVRFPMDVISALLGIPEEYRDPYRAAVDRGLARDPETGEAPEPDPGASIDSAKLLIQLLGERRKDPRDDLITLLAHAEFDDEHGEHRALSDSEICAFVGLLAAAGAETTAKLLGNCIVYLARHPEQRKLLFDEPSRIPVAIEEVLRFDAPSQFQGRVAERDITIHGVTIPEGARVALVTGAACRDEREYPDPDTLDVTRELGRQIYFGHGQHFCLGKSLARLETRVALEEIAALLPDYEVDESGLTRTFQAHVRGFANVPIRPRP